MGLLIEIDGWIYG
jgi:hypothetical protein